MRSSVLLPAAVAADDADLGSRIEREPDVFQNLALAVGFAEMFDGEDVLFCHAVLPTAERGHFACLEWTKPEVRKQSVPIHRVQKGQSSGGQRRRQPQ